MVSWMLALLPIFSFTVLLKPTTLILVCIRWWFDSYRLLASACWCLRLSSEISFTLTTDIASTLIFASSLVPVIAKRITNGVSMTCHLSIGMIWKNNKICRLCATFFSSPKAIFRRIGTMGSYPIGSWKNYHFLFWPCRQFGTVSELLIKLDKTLHSGLSGEISWVSLRPVQVEFDFEATSNMTVGLPWAGVAMQICCAVHLLFLVLFAIFFMNVEVVTRLVWSSSPLGRSKWKYLSLKFSVYIYGFQILQRGFQCARRISVISYCLGYLLLGTILHSNYFPWT